MMPAKRNLWVRSPFGPDAPFTSRLTWLHLLILAALLALGTFLRLDGITQNGLWADEFQPLFLATGRGDAVLNIPRGVIVESPPRVGFDGAPGIGRIWTTLDNTVHPPLYHILLRIWVDLFKDSDFSIRMLSMLMGMIGVVLIFNAIRWVSGPWAALLGATMMTFAPVQVDFCQQARPYTLVAVLCLVLFSIILSIEQNGTSRIKLIALTLVTFAAAMTHYFAFGTIAGGFCYVLFRLRSRNRRYAVAAMAIGILSVAGVWGPIFWKTREIAQPWMNARYTPVSQFNSIGIFLLDIPRRLTFGPAASTSWPLMIAMAGLVYILPLLKFPRISIWYYWVISAIAAPLAIDLYASSYSPLVSIDKYIFLAAPGVYGILAAAMTGRLIAIAACFGITVFGIARFQEGPRFALASAWGLEDHRGQARFLSEHVRKGDLVIIPAGWIVNGDLNEASFTYFIIAHYAGEWKTPVLLLTVPMDDSTRRELSRFHHVWVVGNSAPDGQRLLPNDPLIDVHGATFRDSVWAIK